MPNENEEIKDIPLRDKFTSFEQLEEKQRAEEQAAEVSKITTSFCEMVMNIVESEVEDRVAELQRLTAEYTDRLNTIQEAEQRRILKNKEENMVELAESEQAPISELTESEGGPLHAVVRVIRPGWGNKKHNHYYPKDVLQRDAFQFIGAKMFETDHRPQEKSTRTWVSTVEDIIGFEDGAPLARVAVHDGDFAERLRNLDKLGMLGKMECSIYANGLAKGGFKLGGREGKQVESITGVSSVDWVTRAGAGGAAVSLVETSEELDMDKVEKELADSLEEERQEDSAEETEVEEVEIQESDPEESEPEKLLEVSEVKEILSETELPQYAQTRLAYSGRFMTKEEVVEAAQAELEYIKTVTQSGKPFGMSKKPEKKIEEVDRFAEAEAAKNELAGNFMRNK
jgi:hypothetical protein